MACSAAFSSGSPGQRRVSLEAFRFGVRLATAFTTYSRIVVAAMLS